MQIGIRIDSNRRDSKRPACARNTQCDLASIGYKDFLYHFHQAILNGLKSGSEAFSTWIA
jgi:hypothetical protein